MKCYRVGGAVRDRLLGLPARDSDWVVVGSTPQQLLELGYKAVGRDFPVFLHPQSHEEYALARTERKVAPGYHGFHFHTDPRVTLEEDLLRRDLTINAMAETADGTIIDPYDGQADLQRKQLKHVSPAFVEDPLRVLRTARFAACLDFSVHPQTLLIMQQISTSGELETLAPERVFKELERALTAPHPARFFAVLSDCHALERLFPGLQLQATTATHDTVTALAALFAASGKATVQTLCRRYHMPTRYSHVAIHTAHLWHTLHTTRADAAAWLQLLKQIDAFRRPAPFQQMCAALSAANANPQALHQAWTAANTVTTAETDGLQGRARGEAIDQLRLQRIRDSACTNP